MTDPIRVYVGTSPENEPAERVLEHSIRKHSSTPVETHWMRAGEPPMWDGWKLAWPQGGTPFSPFRFMVPEAAGFEGFAIYLDVDMMVLGDIAELYAYRRPGRVVSTTRPDVMVWDCSAFRDVLPLASDAKESGAAVSAYLPKIQPRWDKCVPNEWDTCDCMGDGNAKLVHFTKLNTQPWKPFPAKYGDYHQHKCQEAVDMFWALHAEATP